jgi:hypothetical protein
MNEEVRSQKSGVRTCHSRPDEIGRNPTRLDARFRGHDKPFGMVPRWVLGLLLVTCHSSLATAVAATHVTATYDLGANPRVMATVNGHAEYGLVFAERDKLVTYHNVEYGPSVVKGYLDASGQLNDGDGNLWLDLIPNLGATPGDSYYVVTFNIQGQVHAEIWVVPDVATVGADLCRQAQAPSSTAPALFYQFLQQAGDDLPQRQKLNFAGAGVNCVDNAGQLRTDCTISGGGGGGSAPLASPTVSGTVKIDAADPDPVVYLKSSADSLLAGKASSVHTHSENDVTNLTADLASKAPLTHAHAESDVTNLVTDLAAKVPTSRSVATSSPLAGGGALSADLTLTCPTCEVTGHKGAQNGYAGLDENGYLHRINGQEVWGLGDLIDYTSKSGSGSIGIGATISNPADNDVLKYSSGNWINSASVAKADALTNDPSDCNANQYATGIAANGNLTCAQPSTANLSDGSNLVKNNQANTYSGGGLQDLSANKLALPAATTLPASCTANKEIFVDTDATPAGQQVYLCNAAGNGWNLIGDGGAGGGGDNISVNGTAATDADFDDATPAAPANAINVKWQKDTGTPNNLSAYVPYTAPLAVTGGNLDCQNATSGQKGCLTASDWSTFDGKASLVASGTAGNGPSKAGTASTAARSDHDHRSIHQLTWFFPGTPATGVQNMTLTFSEVAVNFAILDMRVTANTTSSGSSSFNLQRCTASCTGTSPTFANIYSANLTLGTNTRTAAKGSAPDQNVSGLTAGDQFKANLVTIGASLSDVTVTMTYKYDTTN